MAQDGREELEGRITWARIIELEAKPVQGKFDLDHLKEVNRRIFQDMPKAGFDKYTPGEFRPPAQQGGDWVKRRQIELEGLHGTVFVRYSDMDEKSRSELASTLDGVDPEKLKGMKTEEFTKHLGELYTKLDYIHPFIDGNSRTLRTFTKQLAEASGYDLDWQRFNQSDKTRNELYIARDLGVNKIALERGINNPQAAAHIAKTHDYLKQRFQPLPELLKGVVRPSRAVAFEQLPKDKALSKFPELSTAFDALAAAQQLATQKMPGDTEKQQQAIGMVAQHLQMKLDAGETRQFGQYGNHKEQGQSKTASAAEKAKPEINKPIDRGTDHER
jgi:cell filamentation protein